MQERSKRAAELWREIVLVNRSEERDGRSIRLQLCDTAGALREVLFELGVHIGGKLTLDEIGQQAHDVVAVLMLRHGEFPVSSDQFPVDKTGNWQLVTGDWELF